MRLPPLLLAKIGFLEYLLTLCPQPVIPQGVYEEIQAGAADDPARHWLSKQGKQWVQAAKPLALVIAAWDLGLGETQVLSWCYATPKYEAILDDGQARNCAKTLGIPLRGTLGVVMLARRENLIDSLEPWFACLLETALSWELQNRRLMD